MCLINGRNRHKNLIVYNYLEPDTMHQVPPLSILCFVDVTSARACSSANTYTRTSTAHTYECIWKQTKKETLTEFMVEFCNTVSDTISFLSLHYTIQSTQHNLLRCMYTCEKLFHLQPKYTFTSFSDCKFSTIHNLIITKHFHFSLVLWRLTHPHGSTRPYYHLLPEFEWNTITILRRVSVRYVCMRMRSGDIG